MIIHSLGVSVAEAQKALTQYKAHRGVYDQADWEIERIYRRIAKGQQIISVVDAIFRGGHDEQGRPRLAIARADDEDCTCYIEDERLAFAPSRAGFSSRRTIRVSVHWAEYKPGRSRLVAKMPRIPPQHRPRTGLDRYHLLWEASWTDLPSDPLLLRKVGKDAWVVLAAWDLTDVEMNVLRARDV